MKDSFAGRFTLIMLAAGFLVAGCQKEEVKSTTNSQREIAISRSKFRSSEDSIRWRDHLKASPEDTARAYIMLGILYLKNDYPEVTIRYLELADRYDPGRAITYLNLGHAYNRIGMRMKSQGKEDSMEVMFTRAAESFKWYVQRVPSGEVTEEIYRIVEKYRSMKSEKELPE